MTRAVYDREHLRLTMEGHAGAGVRGTDPVCAAVSMLSMTLERRVHEREEDYLPAVSRGPGRFCVECFPEEGFEESCRECFDTVAAGLALLAEERPAYVSLRQDDAEAGEENAG